MIGLALVSGPVAWDKKPGDTGDGSPGGCTLHWRARVTHMSWLDFIGGPLSILKHIEGIIQESCT